MTVGQNVKAIRLQRGLTQERLAVYAGLTRETIRVIEHGKHSPSVSTLSKIARVLGVSVADLVSDKVPA